MNNATSKRTIAFIFSNDISAAFVDVAVTNLAAEHKMNLAFACGSFYADSYYYYVDFFNHSDEEIDEFSFKVIDAFPILDFVSAM